MAALPRCVIVGPGRTRNGLGPFFARYLVEAGVEVCAGVGRDADRTQRACAELAQITGSRVAPYIDLAAALSDTGAAIAVIASPSAAHAEHLEIAARSAVDVLCEKPLVAAGLEGAARRVDALADSFLAAGHLLVENCQWPFVLPAFEELARRSPGAPERVAMRLSPSGTGRAMLEDSASHLVSVLQELMPSAGGLRLTEIAVDAPAVGVADVRCIAAHAAGRSDVRFELRQVRAQPRPAWLEIDGFRADRVIDSSTYAMRLRAQDGREVPLQDPLRALVYGFVADHRARDLDRLRTHAERTRARARLYADLVAAWPASR
jgi:hypothetical protein